MIRYEIVINDITNIVELDQSRDSGDHLESYDCSIVGQSKNSRKLVVLRRTPSSVIVSLDNKMYCLKQTNRRSSSVEFLCNGGRVQAHLLGHRVKKEEGLQSDIASMNELVSSNFPAKVVSIKVSKGTMLNEGDTLLVLEAMKMEAQIKAPKNCKVLKVFVEEGDMVSRGGKLVQLEFS